MRFFLQPPCTCTSPLQRTSCTRIVLGRERRSIPLLDTMNDPMLRKTESVTPPAKDVVKKKYCAKCQNHQRMEEVRGHKGHCAFQSCRCVKCKTTDEKRKITARNVKAKREESLEKELAAKKLKEELDRKQGVRSVEDRVRSRGEEPGDHVTSSVDFQDAAKDARQTSADKDESKIISPPIKKVKIWNEKGPEKPKVEWNSIITLCDDIKGLEIHHLLHLILKEIAPTVEEARYRIIQAMREVTQEIPGHVWDEHLPRTLSHHYQWAPSYYTPLSDRVKEMQESGMYKLPSALYPRTDPFAFHFPLLRNIPYGFAHTVPSTSYTLPTHEPPRPSLLSYEDFHKFENKGTSPFTLHPEEPPQPFSQVEI